MSDYSSRKPNPHGFYPSDHETFPQNSNNLGSGFTRVEQWITVERLKNEFLFGIPLVSPITGQQLSDDVLKNIISKAAARVELECNIDVFPVVRVTRQPFDYVKHTQGFSQIDLGVRYVREILEVSIRIPNSYTVVNNVQYNNTPESGEGIILYKFPIEWIDPSLMRKGIIHFVPLMTAVTGIMPGPGIGGATIALYNAISQMRNVPGFYFIRYASGFEENSIPSIVNDLIGTYAAMEVLSLLAPTNRWNSQSIGIDGASQGVSGPGNQIYALRIQELAQKADSLKDLIRSKFSNKIFMRHI